jgi:hypothetical protein
MDDSVLRGNGLVLVLEELTKLALTALQTARAGDRRELCEICETLLVLNIRFAAEYRSMLASQLVAVVA